MPGKIVKLHRLLYGLRHAGSFWNHLLVKQSKAFGFEQSRVDHRIFRIRKEHEVTIMLAVHIDVAIEGSREDSGDSLKFLNEPFR